MRKALLLVIVVLMAAPAWAKVSYFDEFKTLDMLVFPFLDGSGGNSEAIFFDVAGVPHGHGPEVLYLKSTDPANPGACKMAIFLEKEVSVSNGVITCMWQDVDIWAQGNTGTGADNDGSLFWREQDTETLPLSSGESFAGNTLRGGYWMEQDTDGGFQLKVLMNEVEAEASGLWPDEDVTGGKEYTGWDGDAKAHLRDDRWCLRDEEFGYELPGIFFTSGPWNTTGWIYHRFWMKDDRVKATFWGSEFGSDKVDMSTLADEMGDMAGTQHWVDAENGWALDCTDVLFGVFPEGYIAMGAWSGESYWAFIEVDDDPDNPDYVDSVETSSWGAIKYQY